MADPFESAWLKWAWAVVNANVLADNINTLATQPDLQIPIALRQDYNAKCHCIIVSVAEIGDLFPPLWGLILGDVVHNFRSALDHVAWALYKRGETPNLRDRAERDIYFPISDDRIKFNNSLERKLPGVRKTDIAKVRRCQPYINGKRNLHRHVLWVLDELSRSDKHRTLQPVIPVPDRFNYTIGQQTDCIFRRLSARTARDILQPGTELTRLYVRRTGPNPYVDVQPQFTVDPTVYDARLTVQEFLGKTISGIRIILQQFSEPSPSARAILGNLTPVTQPDESRPHLLASTLPPGDSSLG